MNSRDCRSDLFALSRIEASPGLAFQGRRAFVRRSHNDGTCTSGKQYSVVRCHSSSPHTSLQDPQSHYIPAGPITPQEEAVNSTPSQEADYCPAKYPCCTHCLLKFLSEGFQCRSMQALILSLIDTLCSTMALGPIKLELLQTSRLSPTSWLPSEYKTDEDPEFCPPFS